MVLPVAHSLWKWCIEQMRKHTRYQDVVRAIVRSLYSSTYSNKYKSYNSTSTN